VSRAGANPPHLAEIPDSKTRRSPSGPGPSWVLGVR
jgi:hypothetical protein